MIGALATITSERGRTTQAETLTSQVNRGGNPAIVKIDEATLSILWEKVIVHSISGYYFFSEHSITLGGSLIVGTRKVSGTSSGWDLNNDMDFYLFRWSNTPSLVDVINLGAVNPVNDLVNGIAGIEADNAAAVLSYDGALQCSYLSVLSYALKTV